MIKHKVNYQMFNFFKKPFLKDPKEILRVRTVIDNIIDSTLSAKGYLKVSKETDMFNICSSSIFVTQHTDLIKITIKTNILSKKEVEVETIGGLNDNVNLPLFFWGKVERKTMINIDKLKDLISDSLPKHLILN